MSDQFSRTRLLLGDQALERLTSSRVAVFGLGGVGGHAAEALARSGVGSLVLVDHDEVALSNLNRQVVATLSAVGRAKVDVMAERIADINPACQVERRKCFFLPDTADEFDFTTYDYVLDAVDTITAKLLLINRAKEAGVPIISAMGAANKLDPTRFEVADIANTSVDRLARIIRKEAHKRGLGHFKVVYSKEPTIEVSAESMELAIAEEGSERVSRHGIPGSVAFVPSVAGLIMAGEVVKDLCR